MMRIVGGEWRGRRLAAPRGAKTRPTSDRAREAVFDVLGSLAAGGTLQWSSSQQSNGVLGGCAAADLYAGSGALGLEALSRGADSCVFVESAPAALRALRSNLSALGVGADRARVIPRECRAALPDEVAAGRRYTVLLADPPYAQYAAEEPLLAATLPSLLAPGGVAVIEAARGTTIRLPLAVASAKVYGDTQVAFLRLEDDGACRTR